MNFPEYYADKVLERLLQVESERDLMRIQDLLHIDLFECGPDPEFEDLVLKLSDEEPTRDVLIFAGELEVLGQKVPLQFRLAYTGVFKTPGHRWGDFLYFSRLEVLAWPADECSPRWTPINDGVLHTTAVRQARDRIVFDHEASKKIDHQSIA